MKFPTVHFETLGCKLNQIETESLARCFADAGFSVNLKPVSGRSSADSTTFLSVINTCTVTSKAEQKGRRLIRLLLQVYPQAAVLVTGCYAQVERDSIEAIDPRIIVVPGAIKDELSALPAYLAEYIKAQDAEDIVGALKSWSPLASLDTDQALQFKYRKTAFALSTDTFLHHSRGSIKIQDGCNNHCSYCRIRLARGPSLSLEPERVLERILDIEKTGQREVVLTGVNLSQYAAVYRGQVFNFADLLDFLLANTAAVSFRISSLYPESVTDSLCAVLAHPRVRPHFHLSVQSGSDAILARMNRPYRRQAVLDAVERLRAAKQNPFIACDMIAGFPGETVEDFEQTLQLCRSCRFAWIHAFSFSPRPGTAAMTMKNHVPSSVVSERVQVLTALALQEKTAYARSWVGKTLAAIIERGRPVPNRAVTENYLHIQLASDIETLVPLAGKEVHVLITKATILTGTDEESEAVGVLIEY